MPAHLAAEWGQGQVLLTLAALTLLVVIVWLILAVLVDVFHNPELPGWSKALWVLVVIILPLLGVLIYLVVRGGEMRPLRIRHGVPAAPEPERLVLSRDQVDAIDALNAERDAGRIGADEYRTRRAQILG